jgi:hypothetical protein
LVNVEEDRQLRRPDPYVQLAADGTPQRGQRELRLILYILFAARFKQYDAAWDHLSKIAEYLQGHPVFDANTTPASPPEVEKLLFEMVTLRFNEQREVWGSLNVSQHPCLLYRTHLVVMRDRKPVTTSRVLEQPNVRIRRTS